MMTTVTVVESTAQTRAVCVIHTAVGISTDIKHSLELGMLYLSS